MLQLTNVWNIPSNSELKIQSIKIDSSEIFKRNDNSNSFPEFYCFVDQENVTNTNDLNFNNLKKCSTCCANKKQNFLVLKLEEKHMAGLETSDWNKFLPTFLHQNKKALSFELKNSDNCNEVVKFDGKFLAILHEDYKPTENSSE